jgi:hypothetical protein
MKRTLAIVSLVALTAASAAWAGVTVRERSDRTEEARGLSRLVVENARGSVQLRPSADGRLHIAAVKTCRAETRERAQGYAQETRVQAGREGSEYVIRVRYPRKVEVRIGFWDLFKDETWENGGPLPRVDVRLVVDVPAGLTVHATTSSGALDSDGVSAAQVLRSASGDIGVRGARGTLQITTASGDVDASDVAGATISAASGDVFVNGAGRSARVTTSSGEITVNGARDSLVLRTASGDLQVDDSPVALWAETASGDLSVRTAAGSARLSATSGSIRMRLRGPLRSADLSTTSGDVHVDFAPGIAADLDVRAGNGHIDSQLPAPGVRRDRQRLTGRLGRGGPPVRIETGSGSIILTGGGK